MAINFPDSPISGTVFTVGDRTWTYDGAKWLSLSTTQVVPADAGRNAIINGAFDIWQRGDSINSTGFFYTADRWQTYSYSGSSATVSKQTFTPGAAPVPGYEGSFFLRGVSTNTKLWLMHYIEDVRTLAGQTVTFSYFAKSATAQTLEALTVTQAFGTGGSAGVTTALTPPTVTSSWQRFAHTFTMPSITGKTIGTNNSVQINFQSAVNNALDIWGVQLEAGSSATAFKRNAPSLQAELAACQRYYYGSSTSGNGGVYSGNVTNGVTYYVCPSFPVTMRAAPTVTITSTSASSFGTSPGIDGSTPDNYTVFNVANATANGAYYSFVTKAVAEL